MPNPAWGVLPIESAKQRRLTRGIDNPLHSQQVNVGDPVAAFASHSADRPSLTKGGRFAVSRRQTRRQTVLVSASARCHPSPRHSLGRCLRSTRSPGRRVRSLHSRTLALGCGIQRFQRIRRSKSHRAKEQRQPSATVCPPAAQPLRPIAGMTEEGVSLASARPAGKLLLRPSSQRLSHQNQLPQVIGVVIGNQQRRSAPRPHRIRGGRRRASTRPEIPAIHAPRCGNTAEYPIGRSAGAPAAAKAYAGCPLV